MSDYIHKSKGISLAVLIFSIATFLLVVVFGVAYLGMASSVSTDSSITSQIDSDYSSYLSEEGSTDDVDYTYTANQLSAMALDSITYSFAIVGIIFFLLTLFIIASCILVLLYGKRRLPKTLVFTFCLANCILCFLTLRVFSASCMTFNSVYLFKGLYKESE